MGWQGIQTWKHSKTEQNRMISVFILEIKCQFDSRCQRIRFKGKIEIFYIFLFTIFFIISFYFMHALGIALLLAALYLHGQLAPSLPWQVDQIKGVTWLLTLLPCIFIFTRKFQSQVQSQNWYACWGWRFHFKVFCGVSRTVLNECAAFAALLLYTCQIFVSGSELSATTSKWNLHSQSEYQFWECILIFISMVQNFEILSNVICRAIITFFLFFHTLHVIRWQIIIFRRIIFLGSWTFWWSWF